MSITDSSVGDPPRRMTWEQYLALGETGRHEYIDGAAVMSPFGTSEHGRCILRMIRLVTDVLPEDFEALTDYGWKPGNDEFGPDVIVVPFARSSPRFTGTPAMVCEVLSQDRSRDLVQKLRKYERAGAPQYWIVDPRNREIIGFELLEDGYEEYVRVDAENRSGTFNIPIGAGIALVLTFEQFF